MKKKRYCKKGSCLMVEAGKKKKDGTWPFKCINCDRTSKGLLR
jgi:hypothetical protein